MSNFGKGLEKGNSTVKQAQQRQKEYERQRRLNTDNLVRLVKQIVDGHVTAVKPSYIGGKVKIYMYRPNKDSDPQITVSYREDWAQDRRPILDEFHVTGSAFSNSSHDCKNRSELEEALGYEVATHRKKQGRPELPIWKWLGIGVICLIVFSILI